MGNETERAPNIWLPPNRSRSIPWVSSLRDVEPGEAVFIDISTTRCTPPVCAAADLSPCIFEYVYLARPDSVIDGVSVYETRLAHGRVSGRQGAPKNIPVDEIDVVIPIPDSSRPSAMQLAQALGIPFREGFVKNRYIGRTFIMPGQSMRKKSVRQKLNTVGQEFKGKRVLLVDDSIVRGTTSREIVEMARAAGALKVYFASAAPPVRFPNVYGIDMPTRAELIATGRTDEGNRPRDRRRCAGLSGSRGAQAVGDRHPLRPDGFRCLLLRRLLHHRRC
jgi:amidophosphoribosyltransferase